MGQCARWRQQLVRVQQTRATHFALRAPRRHSECAFPGVTRYLSHTAGPTDSLWPHIRCLVHYHGPHSPALEFQARTEVHWGSAQSPTLAAGGTRSGLPPPSVTKSCGRLWGSPGSVPLTCAGSNLRDCPRGAGEGPRPLSMAGLCPTTELSQPVFEVNFETGLQRLSLNLGSSCWDYKASAPAPGLPGL